MDGNTLRRIVNNLEEDSCRELINARNDVKKNELEVAKLASKNGQAEKFLEVK